MTRSRRRLAALLIVGGLVLAMRMVMVPPVGALPESLAWAEWKRLGAVAATGPGPVRQSGLWDCGYAALANLLRPARGGQQLFDSLKSMLHAAPGGLTVAQMERLGRQVGVDLRGRSAGDSSWLAEPAPFILLLDRHHYVTLLHRDSVTAVLADPAAGLVQLQQDSLRTLQPIAVLVQR